MKTIQIADELHERLKEIHNQTGLPIGHIAEQAIEGFMNDLPGYYSDIAAARTKATLTPENESEELEEA